MQLFVDDKLFVDENLIDYLLISKKPDFVIEEDLVFWKILLIQYRLLRG